MGDNEVREIIKWFFNFIIIRENPATFYMSEFVWWKMTKTEQNNRLQHNGTISRPLKSH